MATKEAVDRATGRRAEEALRAVLPRPADVRKLDQNVDADLMVGGVPLRVEWVGEGRLGNVRRVLALEKRPDIVVARLMSPGARDALAEAGVGWVDETGAAEIAVGSIVVSRTGHPQPLVEKPARWTNAVLAVAEALICGTPGTVAATEEATGLSTGSCTSALRALMDLGLLVADASRGRGSARRIASPDDFLDRYASAATALRDRTSLQVGVTWRDVVSGLAEVGKQWDKQKVAWAVTGAAAASVVAPYLTSFNTVEVYVDADSVLGLEGVARAAGLRAIEGGRVTLRPFPTVTTRKLASEADGLRVAPWPRVYADLREAGVRGEEAAEHLHEVMRGD
jgi:hypothetical protein